MCAPVCPNGAIRLLDVEDQGLRPFVDAEKCRQCGQCLDVCPGLGLCAGAPLKGAISELRDEWGPVLEVWEGFASDPEIRFRGSSGGAATALALFCIDKRGFAGVLHVGSTPEKPLVNVPAISRNREQLLARTGSRYAPAAPCAGVGMLKSQESRYVFIGKPCDVAAVRKWQSGGRENVGSIDVTISIFCVHFERL